MDKLWVWIEQNPRLEIARILNKTFKFSKRLPIFQQLSEVTGEASQ